MKRALIISLGLPLAAAACGDDGNTATDAAVDTATPDAPEMFKGFAADEGGEVRVEYIKFPGGNAETRVFGFFLKNPGTPSYHDFISLNGCTDARPGSATRANNWPFTMPADSETYDVGDAIYIIGGPQPLKVPRDTTTGPDPLSRPMPANKWYFDPITGTGDDGATYLSPATTYDVALPGTATFPAQYYSKAVYIPQAFDLLSPGNVASLTFPANTPQTFTWTEPTETLPKDAILFSLLGFTGPNGFAVICVEKDDGSMTVPADMMDIALAAYPSGGGYMARQKFVHQPTNLLDENGKPTGRRIDVIGVWCYAGTGYGPVP